MAYCEGASKAIVDYQFPDEKAEVYVSSNPPIDVRVTPLDASTIVSQSFNFTFNGNIEGANYPYVCSAPITVPPTSEIYLVNGVWDDHGSVGTYSTGYGIVVSYNGGAIKVGEGQSVSGQVVNILRVDCYARLTLEWRSKGKYRLEILKNNIVIYSDEGQNQPQFTVACDDQCPQGHDRIPTIKYPGYTCREKCPPNTACECDCGSVICCYGTNGQVLKTIPK